MAKGPALTVKKKTGWSLKSRDILWGCLLAYFGIRLYVIHQDQTFDSFRLTLYSLPFLLLVATVLHELGHAVAMDLTGIKVSAIRLGTTQKPTGPHFSFHFIGFPWEIYSIPVTGSVWGFPTERKGYRTRLIAMTAAGPVVSLIAAGLGLGCYFIESDPISSALLLSWIIVNSYTFLGTAIPMKLKEGSLNDGILIYKALKLTEQEIDEKCRAASFHVAFAEEKKVFASLSVDEAIARQADEPASASILFCLLVKLEEKKDPRFGECLLRVSEHPGTPRKVLINVLDRHLTKSLDAGQLEPTDLYDRLSQKLVEVDNNSVTTRGTRGSVLVDIGRIEEGVAMLEKVRLQTKATIDSTYANIFLALAEKQKGNSDAARHHAQRAAKLDSNCPALKRVFDLLTDTAKTPTTAT